MGLTFDLATSSGGGAGGGGTQSSGSYLFHIDGYSTAKQARNGTGFTSCPFMVGGYPWTLNLYPNSDRPDSAGFVSVFIGLYNCNKRRVSLQVEFSFVDEVDKQSTAHVRTRQVLELFYNYGAGYRRFIATEALERSGHVKGDRLTLRCDLIVTGYVDLLESDPAVGSRKCGACNLRPVTLGGPRLIHACFCEVCKDASRNDPTAKQCAGCHGPYEGECMIPLV